MPTPGDPDEEPAKDGLSDEDAIWRSIVDNYGERPTIDDETDAPEKQAEADPVEIEVPGSPRGLDTDPDERVVDDPEDHFVPPPPPPLPRPAPPRLLAWIGLFGVPFFVLVALVTGLSLPSWAGLLLMAWFVGGFVYLVASMRPPGDGYDDGARI